MLVCCGYSSNNLNDTVCHQTVCWILCFPECFGNNVKQCTDQNEKMKSVIHRNVMFHLHKLYRLHFIFWIKIRYTHVCYILFKLTNHTLPSKWKSVTYRNATRFGTKVRSSNFYYVTQLIKSVQHANKGLSLQWEPVQHTKKTLSSPLKTCITCQ